MSSPIVETVRTIPLVVERGAYTPAEHNKNTGFPFEREADRDGHFRSQLDDIAQRHPEFAEHLGAFTQPRTPTSARPRQSSFSDDPDFHRRFERPFGSRFERFGFPFDRDSFDPEQYTQQFFQPQQEGHQQKTPPETPVYYDSPNCPQKQPSPQQPQPSAPQQTYQPQEGRQAASESQGSQNTENNPPPAPERDRNIQQSNTIDLGQKQEPINDRNQRSMSAPPTEKGPQQQRFTSSIKIPVNQPIDSENMSQPQQQPDTSKTNERIIPIHIEGRDEPVLPKKVPPSFSQPHQTFSNSPQPERIFGQRPEQFTQFINREPTRQFPSDNWHHSQFDPRHGFPPEELLRQQRFTPQQSQPHSQQQQKPTPQTQQQPSKEEIPIPVQRDVPQTKQAPPKQATPPPQPQAPKPQTPIDQIQAVQKDVSALMEQVQNFLGEPRDKTYLYLDEMLTRNLLKLDNIDTQGQEAIRSARKEAIKCIEKAISVLESKAEANVAAQKTEEKMEVEEKPEAAKEQTVSEKAEGTAMETEAAPAGVENKVEEPPKVVPENEPPQAEQKQTANDTKVEENLGDKVTATTDQKTEEVTENKEKPEETSEGQEGNLAVADAVKKFEGNTECKDDKKEEESKPEENKEASQQGEEVKKDKKKGKKKVEKKEK